MGSLSRWLSFGRVIPTSTNRVHRLVLPLSSIQLLFRHHPSLSQVDLSFLFFYHRPFIASSAGVSACPCTAGGSPHRSTAQSIVSRTADSGNSVRKRKEIRVPPMNTRCRVQNVGSFLGLYRQLENFFGAHQK